MTQESSSSSHALIPAEKRGGHSHDRGLLLIGLFKLAKAIFFFCIGVGAIHLLHKDLEDEVMRLALRLRFDPESRFVALLLDKVDLIDAHRLRQISVATFGYSALALTEGVGLLLEKVWAEYLRASSTRKPNNPKRLNKPNPKTLMSVKRRTVSAAISA